MSWEGRELTRERVFPVIGQPWATFDDYIPCMLSQFICILSSCKYFLKKELRSHSSHTATPLSLCHLSSVLAYRKQENTYKQKHLKNHTYLLKQLREHLIHTVNSRWQTIWAKHTKKRFSVSLSLLLILESETYTFCTSGETTK